MPHLQNVRLPPTTALMPAVASDGHCLLASYSF